MKNSLRKILKKLVIDHNLSYIGFTPINYYPPDNLESFSFQFNPSEYFSLKYNEKDIIVLYEPPTNHNVIDIVNPQLVEIHLDPNDYDQLIDPIVNRLFSLNMKTFKVKKSVHYEKQSSQKTSQNFKNSPVNIFKYRI